MDLAKSCQDLQKLDLERSSTELKQDDFTEAEVLLMELKQMKDGFKDIPQKQLHNFIKYELRDDVKDILELYKREIEPMSNDDPVKLEITNIMLYLGINPFKNNDDYTTLNIKELIKEYE